MAKSQTGMPPGEGWRASRLRHQYSSHSQCKVAEL